MKQTTKITSESPQKGHTYRQWSYAILANLALLTFGLQSGWISSSLSVLQSKRSPTGAPLTNDEIAWVASSLSLAAVVAVPVGAILVDRYGRKLCIIGIGVMQLMCWLITIFASSTNILVAARVFGGFAAGPSFNIIPMYVKEISQDNIRGTLGILIVFIQNVGILIMYTMGVFLEYYTVLYLVVGIPVVVILMLMKAPESPTYLVKIGRVDEALSVVASLRGLSVDDKCVQCEISSIQFENEKFKSIPDVSFVGILKMRAWRNGFIYMIIIMIVHGLNGGFCIVTYASTILLRSGVQLSAEVQSLSVPVFMVLGSLSSMVTVERLGRRLLFVIWLVVSVVAFSALSATMALQDHGVAVQGWLVVAASVIAVCAYAAGISPLPFVIMSEMFHFQIRAKVMGVLVTLGWLGSFVQTAAFGPVTDAYGPHVSFLCFAGVNLVGVVAVLALLPETKGKSVDEIEKELDKTTLK